MIPSAYRPYVTSPDGRKFFGRYPQTVRTKEAAQIASLALRVGGIAEVTLPAGRADVATDTDVYEVEPVGSWKAGARQAFAYSAMSGLTANLALFGPADYLPIYLRIRDRMPGLTLWRLRGTHSDGRGWVKITSRAEAARRWSPG